MQKESNFHPQLRRLLLFPLSYASILVRRLGLEPRMFPMCEIYSLGPSPLGRIDAIMAESRVFETHTLRYTSFSKGVATPVTSTIQTWRMTGSVDLHTPSEVSSVFKTATGAAPQNHPYLGHLGANRTHIYGFADRAVAFPTTRCLSLAALIGFEPTFAAPLQMTPS